MRVIKTAAIVLLAIIFSAPNANAWGKKEQGILIGAGAALLLPQLLYSENYHNRDSRYIQHQPARHTERPVKYVQPVEYVQPQQTTYIIQPQKYDFSHHKQKNHNYINKKDYGGERIIIEHPDGSRTVIEK
ncbi:MAG: hypothetical protein LBH45_02490 [Campylobacteraceae bacterium]|jgi:hypothetical protein|nr:hypothetical protein [Campylobacteraceae bacterium]